MGYQYPNVDYGQRVSRQTQNFGGMYEQTNAAQTTSASTPQAYPTGSMPAIGGVTPTHGVRREEECPAAAGLIEAYMRYRSGLTETFQNIRDSVLATASDSLLAASHWLLSHVVELGMCFLNEVWTWLIACHQALHPTTRIYTTSGPSSGMTSTTHGWPCSSARRG